MSPFFSCFSCIFSFVRLLVLSEIARKEQKPSMLVNSFTDLKACLDHQVFPTQKVYNTIYGNKRVLHPYICEIVPDLI